MTALARYVAVQDDDGVTHSFGPDTKELPEWAQRKITNPAVWVDGEVPFPAAAVPDGPGSAGTADAGGGAGGGTGEGPPPRAGKGSGEDKWRAYAAAKGVDLPEALDGRDDIIEFLEAAGVPVE